MERKYLTLLDPQIQDFIESNLDKNPSDLILKIKEVGGVKIQDVVQQIQGKQKAKSKLPSWYKTSGILYPSILSLEQCSSELAANFKANILKGESLLDLTGGLGVDSFAFAQKFKRVYYVERNKDLCEIVQHNFEVLGIRNATLTSGDGFTVLENIQQVDVIYIDPARRSIGNQKLFKLQDCEPDVLNMLSLLASKGKTLLLKTSPILDIKSALKDLKFLVEEVYVVSIENEVKEVLYLIGFKEVKMPVIHAINFQSNAPTDFKFTFSEEENTEILISTPLKFLYEPNAALLKAGAFNSVGRAFSVNKLNRNSHLYTSDSLIQNFPGRKFEILDVLKYDRAELRKRFLEDKANVTVRNFPDSVEKIRKKLGLKEGGDAYIFATTDSYGKNILVLGKKVKES